MSGLICIQTVCKGFKADDKGVTGKLIVKIAHHCFSPIPYFKLNSIFEEKSVFEMIYCAIILKYSKTQNGCSLTLRFSCVTVHLFCFVNKDSGIKMLFISDIEHLLEG